MLLHSARLIGVPVLSLQTGSQIARTQSGIIDPRRLHIVALYCTGEAMDHEEAVIHTADIREFSEIGLIIDSSDDIMPPNDLVRLQETIEYGFAPIGMRVIDTSRRKLGKIVDYICDTDSFLIHKLVVKRPIFQAFNDTELIIDRQQIAEVTRDYIMVKAPTVEEKKPAQNAAAPVFDNPFRNKSPQIESSSTKES